MNIDLSIIQIDSTKTIPIDGSYTIPKEYYENTDIIDLSDISIKGTFLEKENDDFELDDYFIGTISGVMYIPDSISLEKLTYPFSIEYDDFIPKNCIKNENLLDIFQFLWENTVLEVPLQFTKESDLSKFHGDGWRLISEDQLKIENNPFSDLLKDFEEE